MYNAKSFIYRIKVKFPLVNAVHNSLDNLGLSKYSISQ